MTTLLQITTFLILLLSTNPPTKKTNTLQNKITQIVTDKNATVGVSIIANKGKDLISLNADKQFPLQSVFKYHIGLAVLAQVDAGKFSLEQEMEIGEKDLLPKIEN